MVGNTLLGNAALSLRNHDDPVGFIKAFSRSHRYGVDYLLEEALSRQSKAVQGSFAASPSPGAAKSPWNYSFWALACLCVVSYAFQRYLS